MKDPIFIEQARELLEDSSPLEILQWAAESFKSQVTLASSLGAEDQVLTHLVAVHRYDIPIFMLDTGRHFEETYQLLEETQRQYDIHIKQFFPDHIDVEEALNEYGPNFFRNDVSLRKHCCYIRKVKPLRRALHGYSGWVTGLRREQSPTRDAVRPVEWDEGNGLYKINPLWRWTENEVWDFIKSHDIPFNKLHDQGFPSIGCQPCTRAIEPGEDPRAGRWWWENPESKECGLHLVNGRLVRAGSSAEQEEQPQPIQV